MDTLQQTQVFFFISSVGFVILGILAVIFLYYAIRAIRAFSDMAEKIEKDVDEIGDTTKDMVDDIRDSAVFKFLFKKKKRSRKNH